MLIGINSYWIMNGKIERFLRIRSPTFCLNLLPVCWKKTLLSFWFLFQLFNLHNGKTRVTFSFEPALRTHWENNPSTMQDFAEILTWKTEKAFTSSMYWRFQNSSFWKTRLLTLELWKKLFYRLQEESLKSNWVSRTDFLL